MGLWQVADLLENKQITGLRHLPKLVVGAQHPFAPDWTAAPIHVL